MKQSLEFVGVGGTDYETVGASATDQVLGGAGALNDLIARLVVTVNTSATSTLSIKDGAGASIPLVAANAPIGTFDIEIGARSKAGAWSVTTGAGVTVVAVGQFSI